MSENNISKNLKYLRKKRGLTQAKLRCSLGVTRSTWSNYENGVTSPSINDLVNFSSFFGISLDELILHDLALKDPLTEKEGRKKPVHKYATYVINDASSSVAEPDIMYVLKELEKLREEVKMIRHEK